MLSDKRDKMLEEMKTLRDKMVPEWEDILKQAQAITVGYLDDIDEIDKEMVARAKAMREQIDTILSQNQKTLQKLKATGLAKLKDQEKYLTDRLQKLKEDVKTYENHLLDADPTVLLQFKEGARESLKALETASVPVFTRGQDDIQSLEGMFGSFGSRDANKDTTPVVKPPITSKVMTKTSEETISQARQLGPKLKTEDRSLIKKPTVKSQFNVANNKPHIACTEQDWAWMSTNANTLQLVDRNGSVKDTLKTDFFIYDIALTSDGELLLADYNDNCVKLVSKHRKISILFNTNWGPTGLCCLHNSDIVVSFKSNNKVIVYSRSGHIRQTLDNIKFRYPHKVAVNKVNQDICVCVQKVDYLYTGKLLAVGADGQLRYEYSGQGDSEFTPANVCTDHMGHVLITDIDNDLVHILDQEGQFIQYILTSQRGLSRPITIDVDREGYVWVGEYSTSKGHVKVAKYLQ